MLEAEIPPGGTCGGRPCWEARPGGFTYKDPERTPDGIERAMLSASATKAAKISVTGKGPLLPFDDIPETPVIVRLARSEAPACFEATYSNATRRDKSQLKARSD